MGKKGSKLVRGIGINDADYDVFKRLPEGKTWVCPYYRDWANMLTRCSKKRYSYVYDTNYHKCYIGVTCCDEWIYFSKFKEWAVVNKKPKCSLDKDLLGDGTIYSPNTCFYIPAKINSCFSNINKVLDGEIKGFTVNQGKIIMQLQYDKESYNKTCESIEEAYNLYLKTKVIKLTEITRKFYFSGGLSEEVFNSIYNKILLLCKIKT